jgi:hypothetical protein
MVYGMIAPSGRAKNFVLSQTGELESLTEE